MCKITAAKSAGFCFGVERAVNELMRIAKEKKTVTLGPIIHNGSVIEKFESLGVKIVNSPDETPKGATLAIRTHGVKKSVIEKIKSENIDFCDLTCPFVKKIHNIVSEYHEKGYKIIIAGDKHHPEVDGINGWCDDSALVISDLSELDGKISPSDRVCLVAQTTMDKKNYEKIKKFVKISCQNPIIFDTICSATEKRQKDAEKISKTVDIMLVVGGKMSANTKRLADISRKYCKNTFQIETVRDLPLRFDIPKNKIGITAGASTPPWIIKEVVGEMEEMVNGEVSFAEVLKEHEKEQALVTLKTGDIVKGTVMRVEPNGVSVNLGYKSDGFIPASEVVDDPEADICELINVGDEIEVFVVRVNDVEGEVTLSKRKIDAIKSEKVLEEAFENETVLTGKVVEILNGGVLVAVNGGRIFVPAKFASDRYLADLSVLQNLTVDLKIIEISKKRGRTKIVGSIAAVIREQKKKLAEEFWNNVEVGKTYTGVVKSLTKFGAFVDIGGVDGLVHISELSWSKIKHPSEVVSEGETVEVYVIDFNKETGKVSLGYKKACDNPWEKAKAELEVGKDIDCKIVRIVPFGAFAEIYPGVDGLIHISQVAAKRIGKVEDELSVGQHVTARVVELDFENKKIGLSIRAIIEEAQKAEEAEIVAEENAKEEAANDEAVSEETAETTEE